MDVKQNYITCNHSHRMAYTEWGDTNNPNVLICVHGLTRNSRDFDFLAKQLCHQYRVICPDIIGRGKSDWLPQAKEYNYETYVTDMLNLMNQLNLKNVDWLGTSMGGIIGMSIAATQPQLIRRLILNDIGAFVSKQALQRISTYLKIIPPFFKNLKAVEMHLRDIYMTFGYLPDEQWQQLAIHGSYKKEGRYYLGYDPKIFEIFQQHINQDIDLWQIWQAINIPMMVIHGEDSDVLTQETLNKMKAIHPSIFIVHYPNVGHAPMLMTKAQTDKIINWLLK